jgi:hypothetical protein
MKKLKIGVVALMFSGMSYAQSVDTLASGIAGKIHFKFDYYTSTIVDKIVTNDFEDITIEIKENQVMYIDLYDNCKCNKYKETGSMRDVKFYMKNGEIVTNSYESGDITFEVLGENVFKIIITKPYTN